MSVTKNERLFVRVSAEMKQQLAEEAAKQNRTISNLLETLIKQHIEKQKQ